MRNLVEHPVTVKEVVETLANIAIGYDRENAMGDIRPLILRLVIKVIQDNPDLLEKAIQERTT